MVAGWVYDAVMSSEGVVNTGTVQPMAPSLLDSHVGSSSSSNSIATTSMKRVDILIQMLHHARTVSRMDLADTQVCYMSADLAFRVAYRRLKRPTCVELAKALSVRISTLLDSLKADSASNSGYGPNSDERWSRHLEQVSDLVHVFCSETSAEFQHFYELLLARRLLRYRFISLSTERMVLDMLPAMTKSTSMLTDIESTTIHMKKFRKTLLKRIDDYGIHYPNDVSRLTFDGESALNIHLLAGSVWPSSYLNVTKYAALQLPHSMRIVMQEYQRFFQIEDANRPSVSNNHNVTSTSVNGNHYYDITLSGATGNIQDANGVYKPSLDTTNGWPLYILEGDLDGTHINSGHQNEANSTGSRYMLEYSHQDSRWQLMYVVDSSTALSRNVCIAYCPCNMNGGVFPDRLQPRWRSRQLDIHNVWQHQPISITPVNSGSVNSYTSISKVLDPGLALDSERPRRRLVWCHGSGSALLKMNCNDGESAIYMLISEPQVAVLMAFQHTVGSKVRKKVNDTKNDTTYSGSPSHRENLTNMLQDMMSSRPFGSVNDETDVTMSDTQDKETLVFVPSPVSPIVLTTQQLKDITHLTSKELQEVIASLTVHDVPLLCCDHDETSIQFEHRSYKLSPALWSGQLGGHDSDDPLILSNSLADYDNSLSTLSVRKLHDWRNELLGMPCVHHIMPLSSLTMSFTLCDDDDDDDEYTNLSLSLSLSLSLIYIYTVHLNHHPFHNGNP